MLGIGLSLGVIDPTSRPVSKVVVPVSLMMIVHSTFLHMPKQSMLRSMVHLDCVLGQDVQEAGLLLRLEHVCRQRTRTWFRARVHALYQLIQLFMYPLLMQKLLQIKKKKHLYYVCVSTQDCLVQWSVILRVTCIYVCFEFRNKYSGTGTFKVLA